MLPCEVLTLIVPLTGHEHELGHVLVRIVLLLLVLGVVVVVGRLLGWWLRWFVRQAGVSRLSLLVLLLLLEVVVAWSLMRVRGWGVQSEAHLRG